MTTENRAFGTAAPAETSRRHPEREAPIEVIPKSYVVRHRTKIGQALFLILLPVLLIVRPPWAFGPLHHLLDAMGYVLIVLGTLGRLWSTLYIGGRKNRELQQTGPYSVVRHPLYVSSFLLGLALAFITANPLVLALVLTYFIIQYRTTIRHEETELTELFGDDYRAYQARVPCFLPRFSVIDPAPPPSVAIPPLMDEVRANMAYLAFILVWKTVTMLQAANILGKFIFPNWP